MSFFQVGRSPIMKIKSEVLALKYRPQSFNDLIGQEEIAKTIYNSIKINKSPNAYLFTGIRGVGKTTFARIVAKALNCKNGIENLCNKNFCENCASIINSNHIDVLEIDAASKTGVDDVRELLEFSRYAPSVAKYKVFIIDEVHMLSKQAFNALLKTLEEPPEYLKFIFATTEVKKIPITVVSRCQRYDLLRIRSEILFKFIKHVAIKENKSIDDDSIKLIVKISEGSVRDALSLLDRALISNSENKISIEHLQNIFGYVDRSSYINLFKLIFNGDEPSVLNHYRSLYDSGVEPQVFLNEFLEILYYIKNISYINLDSSSFSLNDSDYNNIKTLSKELLTSEVLLFWEFTLKVIKEIHLVRNPNLSIEMFLIQLMYLSSKNKSNKMKINKNNKSDIFINQSKQIKQVDTIDQIKNIKQEEEKIEKKGDVITKSIKNINELILVCLEKKEMRLKYELENNVNLISFANNRIEISFNEKLNKDFVKSLSEKLYNWTNTRWIISFSKKQGEITKKVKDRNLKIENIKKFKKTNNYSELIENLPDIELTDIIQKDD